MGFSTNYPFLATFIAGDIVLSPLAGTKIKQWRQFFDVSQKELADAIDITASVISDYESGRRKKPGTEVIQNIVSTLISLDERKEVSLAREVGTLFPLQKGKQDAPLQTQFKDSIGVSLLLETGQGKAVTGKEEGFVATLLFIDPSTTSFPLFMREGSKTNNIGVVFLGNSSKERLSFLLAGIGRPYISIVIIPTHTPLSDLEKRVVKVLGLSTIMIDFQTIDDLISRLSSLTKNPYI